MASNTDTTSVYEDVKLGVAAHSSSVAKRKTGSKAAAKETKSSLEHYFGQLTGTEDPDQQIVKEKLISFRESTNMIIATLTAFVPGVQGLGYEEEACNIKEFVTRAEEFHDLLCSYISADPFGLDGTQWGDVKNHDFIQTCMVTCKDLSIIHRQFMQSWDTVDRKFMNRFTGLKFTPFAPWCNLDIKHMWLIDGDHEKDLPELLFTVMKKLFHAMRTMYDMYMSPDVNISDLSELIIAALGDLRKKIPRCDKAFNTIEASARMLKDNFGEYYRDFLETKDPNNIFTAFISDVSKSCGNDTMLIIQCRKIVEFYKKHAAIKIASGEMSGEKRKMVESLLNNYKMLNKNASETAGISSEGTDELGDSDSGKEDEAEAISVKNAQEEDARDLDELMKQIENPRVMSVSVKNKKRVDPSASEKKK